MIDKQGRLFGKISIVDIIIVILIILAGSFFFKQIGLKNSKDLIAKKTDNLQIVFHQEEINDFTANNVEIGDIAKESLHNANIGTVTDVILDDAIVWEYDLDGIQVKSSKEGFSSIDIVMETTGVLGPNGITLDGSTYYLGQTITLKVGSSIFYGEIKSAEKVIGG